MKKELKEIYRRIQKSIENCDLKIYESKRNILNKYHIEYNLSNLLQLQKDKCYLESSLKNINTMYFDLKEYKI